MNPAQVLLLLVLILAFFVTSFSAGFSAGFSAAEGKCDLFTFVTLAVMAMVAATTFVLGGIILFHHVFP